MFSGCQSRRSAQGSVYLVFLSWSKPIERGGVSQTQEALGEDGTLRTPSGGCDDLKREKKPGGRATRKRSQICHQGFSGGGYLIPREKKLRYVVTPRSLQLSNSWGTIHPVDYKNPHWWLQEMLGEKWPGMNNTFSEPGARGKHTVEKHG